MGKFIDISIRSVIAELNNSYFLPDVQREYVWLNSEKEKKIESLFDSILRGYPIGSFLFWKLNKNDIETDKNIKDNSEKLNFQLYKFVERYDERKPHNEKVNIEQVNSDSLTIVLDGQQRLTSLYIGLKGSRTLKKPYSRAENLSSYEEKKLYLNLRHKPSSDNPDDNYQFEFKKDIPKADENNYWFKVGDILDLKSVLSYSLENSLEIEEGIMLERLNQAICTDSIISYFEETEKNLDKVLKIFIRVNSGGTVLSYSDLLMSLLTANFSSDIRGLMDEFIDSIKHDGFPIFGRDQMLKTCLILTDSEHIFKLKNFCKSNISKIEINWDKITSKIFLAISLLKDLGYQKQLSSAYIISIISYYLYKKDITKITSEDKDEIWKFVRNAQITAYFTTSLDNKISIALKCIQDTISFQNFNDNIQNTSTNPLRISNDDVERMLEQQYGSPTILPILQVLYPNFNYKNNCFHIDHIFPKSKFKGTNLDLSPEHYKMGNFLYNLQLLEETINNEKRAKDPQEWINKNFNGDTEKINNYLDQNYIPRDISLDWDNIDEFAYARNTLLLKKLKEAFGN